MHSAGAWSRRERLLPHPRARPPRGAGRRRGRRASCAVDPPRRRVAARPAAPRHVAGQCVGVTPARCPDRARPLPRPGFPSSRRDRSGAVRWVHHMVDRQLGDDSPPPHRPPVARRRLHRGRPGGLPRRRCRRNRAHRRRLASGRRYLVHPSRARA